MSNLMLYILTGEFFGIMAIGLIQHNWGLAIYGFAAALIQVSVLIMGR